MTTKQTRKYGWKPDVPDARDRVFMVNKFVAKPPKASLRDRMPAVYDQGDLGSCTANAIAACHQFEQISQGQPAPFPPSRLFIYYNERKMENTVLSDSGAMIRDGIKSVNQLGVCEEAAWPYDIDRFTAEPDESCYTQAAKHKAIEYLRVPRTAPDMESVIAEGRPFVVGISVYESFESAAVAKSGKVALPKKKESLLGGHAVAVVGYDRTKMIWECRNSWGTGWGKGGYFTLPYSYLLNQNLSDDFWVIRAVA